MPVRWMGRVLVVAALVAVTADVPLAAAAGASCVAMRVRDTGILSTVDRTEYPALATTTLGTIPYRLNALGYLRSPDLAYGMTAAGHVVTIDRRGRTSDLGPPEGKRLLGMTSGAISGTTWYLEGSGSLYTVDIEPGRVSVRGSVLLHPWLPGAQVADFALDPSDGLLYGVASTGVVVSIDPRSGQTRLTGAHLPPASAYGSVVLAPDGALYVTANVAGGRSREYRVTRQGAVTELGTGPAATSTDAAGCLAPLPAPSPPPSSAVPPAPAVPVPPPPSSTSPSPPPVPAPPSPAPPPPPAPVPAPQSAQPRPTPPPPTSSPPVSRRPPPSTEKSQASAADRTDATKAKRDWALAALLLILGGSIVARRIAR